MTGNRLYDGESDRADWRTLADRAVITKRWSWHYREAFDSRKNELVLDLGSGKSPYAPKNVIRTDVIYANQFTPRRGKNVASLLQELPFADQTFDRVTASFSMYWVSAYNGGVVAVKEALRVLKPDGELQILPASINHFGLADDLSDRGITEITHHRATVSSAIVGVGLGLGVGLAGHALGLHDGINVGLATGTTAFCGIARYSHESRDVLTIHNAQVPQSPSEREATIETIVSAYGFMKETIT